jgi:hypothetical protein
MYEIDLETGEMTIDGEKIELDKKDCVVGQKEVDGKSKIAIACGDDKKERLMEKLREF